MRKFQQRTKRRRKRYWRIPRKFLFYLLIIVLGCCSAGLFLTIHDSIHYSTSFQDSSTTERIVTVPPPHSNAWRKSKDDRRRRRRRSLIHVVNPFVDNTTTKTKMSTDHLFHPLNMEQWIMLMSIQRAKDAFRKHHHHHHHHRNTTTAGSTNHHQHNHDDDSYWLVFDEIQVVCSILESELDTLLLVREILASSCDRIVSLSKSTATEYGLKKALPFLQELYTSSTTGQEDDDSYYWMITNADICVTPNIYIVMEQELRERQAMALSINRMTIDFDPAAASASLVPKITRKRNDKGSDTAVDVRVVVETLLDDLLRKTKDFQNHPGYDCF
eukprot:scaffold24390_cov152-Cylindrotheca_fusiformis.AAC.1